MTRNSAPVEWSPVATESLDGDAPYGGPEVVDRPILAISVNEKDVVHYRPRNVSAGVQFT